MKYSCGPPEFQLEGRLHAGCGQGGHLTASLPNDVAAAPLGLCPWPECLSIKICLQIRLTQ